MTDEHFDQKDFEQALQTANEALQQVNQQLLMLQDCIREMEQVLNEHLQQRQEKDHAQ